uniref:Uncharacterized protein n=1 Tax=Rhizophora mucronata TaxID=61149 RepID=A0A2P2PGZ2_RHIMU
MNRNSLIHAINMTSYISREQIPSKYIPEFNFRTLIFQQEKVTEAIYEHKPHHIQ